MECRDTGKILNEGRNMHEYESTHCSHCTFMHGLYSPPKPSAQTETLSAAISYTLNVNSSTAS